VIKTGRTGPLIEGFGNYVEGRSMMIAVRLQSRKIERADFRLGTKRKKGVKIISGNPRSLPRFW